MLKLVKLENVDSAGKESNAQGAYASKRGLKRLVSFVSTRYGI